MKPTGPLFKWFGSKWLSSKTLPEPRHDMIFEPFAGGAGYSLRHSQHDVVLCEKDVHIYSLWEWIIGKASEFDVKSIPIDIPEGTDIRTLGLSNGQALLLKNWQRTNNVGDCWTVSPWGNKPGQWTRNTRSRVAEEIQCVKHWKVYEDGFYLLDSRYGDRSIEATWFIDPPYQYNYQYRSKKAVDYGELARHILHCNGQVIVCEAVDSKTGRVPEWLPFREFGSRITSRRKANNNHHSKELIWTSDD